MKKSSYWPIGIAGFFSIFVLTLVGFIAFSRTQKINLVSKNYYNDEIKYQEQIDRIKRTRALQKTLTFQFDKKSKAIFLQFPVETDTAAIAGKILFFRPSNAKLDRMISIKPGKDGRQVIDVKNLSNGFWRAKIFWIAGGAEYYHEATLIVE